MKRVVPSVVTACGISLAGGSRSTLLSSAPGGSSRGTCSRSSSITGPQGRGVSRSGFISTTGNSSATYGRTTTTGPTGGRPTRSGSVSASR